MVKEVLSREIIKFHQMFPLIDDDYIWRTEEEEKEYHAKVREKYNVRCISVFDHWLSDEEYSELMIWYQRKFNKEDKERYYQYEKLFIKFYLYLFNNTKVYARFNDRIFISFDSQEEYLSHVLLSVRDRLFLKIILPEYHTIIDGGHDLTDILKVKKNFPEGLETISKIVKDHGLFILGKKII